MIGRYMRAIKASAAVFLSSGAVWLGYEVHTTVNTINNILHTSILDNGQNKVEFIYWEDSLNQSLKSTFTEDKTKDEEQSILPKFLLRWWICAQKSLAWRLLHVVEIGNKYEKQRAIKSLASLQILSDADYQMLAQACSAQIAVALARTEHCDLRFFLRPPYLNKKCPPGKELKEKIIDLLHAMENRHHHACLENFLSTYERKKWREHSHEDAPGTSLSPLLEEEIISKALEVLAHHCSIDNNAEDLLHVASLPLLMQLICAFEKNVKMLADIFSIISYLSTFPDALKAFHASGWLGVLTKYSRNPNASLALPCIKSLANLDGDSVDNLTYPHRIFPLYPPFRSNGPHKADIIFIHGLLGTVFITWRQRDPCAMDFPTETSTSRPSYWSVLLSSIGWNKTNSVVDTKSETPETSHLSSQQYTNQLVTLQKEDYDTIGNDFEFVLTDLPTASSRSKEETYSLCCPEFQSQECSTGSKYSWCWPRDWLPQDCPNVRVLGVNYTTSLSQWFPKCPNQMKRAKIADRSIEYMQMLHKVGVGKRPIIWVTHSMGGLLVKQMLVKAYESDNREMHNIFQNTKAIVFFSCPHLGSEVADLKTPTEMLFWPSIEVQELRYRSPGLLDLHLRFLQLLEVSPMSVLSFAETKATNVTAVRWPVNFVQPHSADPGVGEFFEIPLNHIDICKPGGRHSFLYRKVVDLINHILSPH